MRPIRILAQPDDSTCGPTALHAVYASLGLKLPLEQVIEVNECPNIDHGVEDVVLGDDLYRAIIGSLKTCIEEKIGIPQTPTVATR